MAERLLDGYTQALQQFVNESPWDPLPVSQRIAERLSGVVRPEAWVIDDVSFPQCGKASVGVARQYCGVVGKRANCQVAVSVHAATDTASCSLDWQLYLAREWTDESDRCRRAGIPEDVVHREKCRLALRLLDTLAQWKLEAPVVIADAGYGVSTPFRLGLQERGRSYVLTLHGKEVAHPADVEPHQPAYGGLGPLTLPRYRTPPRAICTLAAEAGAERFTEVTWRQGSKGAMTSRFAVLSNLPATTPAPDLVRRAKMRWRIEHDYRELKHSLGLDHFEGRTRARPAPPRHSRHRRQGIPHPPQARPKSRGTHPSLYQTLDRLQDLLRCWTGTCTTCGRPLTTNRTRT